MAFFNQLLPGKSWQCHEQGLIQSSQRGCQNCKLTKKNFNQSWFYIFVTLTVEKLISFIKFLGYITNKRYIFSLKRYCSKLVLFKKSELFEVIRGAPHLFYSLGVARIFDWEGTQTTNHMQ